MEDVDGCRIIHSCAGCSLLSPRIPSPAVFPDDFSAAHSMRSLFGTSLFWKLQGPFTVCCVRPLQPLHMPALAPSSLRLTTSKSHDQGYVMKMKLLLIIQLPNDYLGIELIIPESGMSRKFWDMENYTSWCLCTDENIWTPGEKSRVRFLPLCTPPSHQASSASCACFIALCPPSVIHNNISTFQVLPLTLALCSWPHCYQSGFFCIWRPQSNPPPFHELGISLSAQSAFLHIQDMKHTNPPQLIFFTIHPSTLMSVGYLKKRIKCDLLPCNTKKIITMVVEHGEWMGDLDWLVNSGFVFWNPDPLRVNPGHSESFKELQLTELSFPWLIP